MKDKCHRTSKGEPGKGTQLFLRNYSYDLQGELTAAGSASYSYDANGNRNLEGYTYDTTNTNEITSDGTWNYEYDANGNITLKVNISDGSAWQYGYDNANHMVSAKEWSENPILYGTDEATLLSEDDFKYDVFGNRVEQDVTVSGVTTVQRYAIDGWDPAKSNPVGNEDYDVWADLDGSSSLTTRYLRGDQVDQLLGRVDVAGSATGYWTLTDHLGSIRDVIDNTGTGTVADAIEYDAFGNITNEYNDAYRGRYAWTGRELDVETGLQYNRARYYDSTTGRWISQDPMGFDAGDSNLYRYAKNSPVHGADPSGNLDAVGIELGLLNFSWPIPKIPLLTLNVTVAVQGILAGDGIGFLFQVGGGIGFGIGANFYNHMNVVLGWKAAKVNDFTKWFANVGAVINGPSGGFDIQAFTDPITAIRNGAWTAGTHGFEFGVTIGIPGIGANAQVSYSWRLGPLFGINQAGNLVPQAAAFLRANKNANERLVQKNVRVADLKNIASDFIGLGQQNRNALENAAKDAATKAVGLDLKKAGITTAWIYITSATIIITQFRKRV